jgi:hypothetical protein
MQCLMCTLFCVWYLLFLLIPVVYLLFKWILLYMGFFIDEVICILFLINYLITNDDDVTNYFYELLCWFDICLIKLHTVQSI